MVCVVFKFLRLYFFMYVDIYVHVCGIHIWAGQRRICGIWLFTSIM